MSSRETELLECLCGRGWDAEVVVDVERAGALLAAESELCRQSVYVAAAVGDVAALEALLAADPAAVSRAGGPRGWEPLLYNCYSFAHQLEGREEAIVEALGLLLDRGADPACAYTVPDQDNPFSALYGTIAVTCHRPRTMALLAAGAPPSDGNSSFHAVETFDIDLLRALCDHGLEREDASYTIKHAIDMQWETAVRVLLDHGADPNAIHPADGETTLHWAIKRSASEQVIKWLLEAGADPDVKTASGRTSTDFALRFGHLEALALMKRDEAGASDDSDAAGLIRAVARGDEAAAKALLARAPALLDAMEDDDRAMLASWAQHGRRPAVELAIKLGFPLDSTAWMGLTALHWAALRGDLELARLLVQADAPFVDLGGFFGTPHDTASQHRWYQSSDYDAIVTLLTPLADAAQT